MPGRFAWLHRSQPARVDPWGLNNIFAGGCPNVVRVFIHHGHGARTTDYRPVVVDLDLP